MNRKLNAAITAGLSLSMVLGSTPVTAIAAQVQQPAAKSATEANDWCVLNVYDEADGQQLLGISVQKGQKKVTEALEGNVPAKPGYKIDYLYTQSGLQFSYDEATNTWSGNEATVNDNMDLYVHFVEKQETPAAKQFTVTYYDGDTVLDKKTFDEGSYEYVNYTPQKDGYTFEGWAMNGSNEKIVATKNPLKGNWGLTALWKKNDSKPSTEKRTVLVQYFDEGYDPIIRVVDFEGSTTWMNQKPMDKPGKVFVGWKYTGADDSEIIKPGQPLNYTDESVNLQAVWADAPVEYATVTFYDEGDQPIGNATYQVGSFNWDAITPAPKDGKVFVGWKYTGASDDQIIDFATTPILADVSLQAVWKDAAKETHTVNFYDEGYDPIIQLVDFAGSTTWMNQTPAAKDGKVFVGWKFVGADDSEIIPAGTELKADWNVQAVWKDAEAAVHTVTYYDEGYEPIGYGEIRAGQFNWDQVKPAAKDGYTFVGYKFTGDTDDHIIDFSKTAMPDADVCLQAVWQKNAEPTPEPTENEHTVTIYENGKVSTVKVKDGEKLSKPADPEAVAGYEFVGWSTSKSEMAQYDFDQPVTGDLTIYAMFNAKKETVENGKAEDSKKQVAADKKNEAKAEKKDAAALPTTGDPIFVVTSAASLAGAVAAAVGMYMTKRREH
ncbi:MAG: InlB B-repeat-containing protein, partial [Collinsella sp.]|nr:InlB B-repeat-containing protein [Collinsella sp.]